MAEKKPINPIKVVLIVLGVLALGYCALYVWPGFFKETSTPAPALKLTGPTWGVPLGESNGSHIQTPDGRVIINSTWNPAAAAPAAAAPAITWENIPVTLVVSHTIADWMDTYLLPTTLWWGTGKFVLQGQRTDTKGIGTYSDISALFGTMIANGMATGDNLGIYLTPRIDNALSTKRLLVWRRVYEDGTLGNEWIVRAISANQPSKEFWLITATMGSFPPESDGRTMQEVTTPPSQSPAYNLALTQQPITQPPATENPTSAAEIANGRNSQTTTQTGGSENPNSAAEIAKGRPQ